MRAMEEPMLLAETMDALNADVLKALAKRLDLPKTVSLCPTTYP